MSSKRKQARKEREIKQFIVLSCLFILFGSALSLKYEDKKEPMKDDSGRKSQSSVNKETPGSIRQLAKK